MDKIIVHGAKFEVNLGVTEEERKKKQQIGIDITLFFDINAAASTDDIEKTINYSLVCKHIATVLNKEYRLIETIAGSIAAEILDSFPVTKVEICVKKPSALRIAEYTAVEVVREK